MLVLFQSFPDFLKMQGKYCSYEVLTCVSCDELIVIANPVCLKGGTLASAAPTETT